MPTILDLFKGSPQDTQVQSGKETFGTQERDGIRVSSLVDANNPLIYGTGAIRIANRSIETTEIQKDGTGTSADGGLVGKGLGALTGGKVNSLSEARTAVTSKLGFPQKLIPTRVASDDDFTKGKEPDTMSTLAKIRKDGQGSLVGQFLQSTGGGNPQTVGKQAVGQGIGLIKDKAREVAFGGQQTVGQISGQPLDVNYSSQQTYSDVVTSEGRNIYNEGGEVRGDEVNVRFGNASTDKIDLRSVSPIYGIERPDNKFGKSNSAYTFKNRENETLPTINPTNTYLESLGRKQTTPLDTDRRFSGLGEGDGINQTGVNDEYDDKEIEGYNLIPFWIKTVDAQKAVHFRTIIDGLTEQVSPTWNDNSFLGNPYKYYTYSGVEREVTFNLKIYCMNPTELVKNWEKIQYLTSKTYPFIPKGQSYFDAPFIRFRLGNMYVNKVGFISSLNYTIDDNTPWETEIDGFYLPKFVTVAITIKLVEKEGDENVLYNYARSRESIEQLKESRETTAERRDALATVQQRQEVPRVTITGGTSITPPSPRRVKSSQGGEIDTPRESQSQSNKISLPAIEKVT